MTFVGNIHGFFHPECLNDEDCSEFEYLSFIFAPIMFICGVSASAITGAWVLLE